MAYKGRVPVVGKSHNGFQVFLLKGNLEENNICLQKAIEVI